MKISLVALSLVAACVTHAAEVQTPEINPTGALMTEQEQDDQEPIITLNRLKFDGYLAEYFCKVKLPKSNQDPLEINQGLKNVLGAYFQPVVEHIVEARAWNRNRGRK